jgi:hypothetical protein
MNASGASKTLLSLESSRVRVEPRLLSPLPATNDDALYTVMVGSAPTRDEIEESEKEIQKLANEDAHVAYDTDAKTWRFAIGSKRPLELKNSARVSKRPDLTQPSMDHRRLRPLLLHLVLTIIRFD